MRKVALYTLEPKEKFLLKGIVFTVTTTKTVVTEGSNQFQQIYCKATKGKEFVHAPAGLMVTKVE